MKKKKSKSIEKNKKSNTIINKDNIIDKELNEKNAIRVMGEDDKEWIKILKNDLDNFSIGSSSENSEDEIRKEIIQNEFNEKKLIDNENKPLVTESLKQNINLEDDNLIQKDNIKNEKINNEEININSIKKENESIFFDGKEFKKYSRYNIYNSKRKIKKVIYKCINIRKDDRIRRSNGQPSFCNATIEYIEPEQNVKTGYFMKTLHSEECIELDYKKSFDKIKSKIEKEEGKENFIILCNEIMEKSNIYDRRLFKEEFKKIYNQNKYNFPINENFLSNIISKWKKGSDRFTKMCVFKNKFDNENRLILRDYRIIPIIENNKLSTVDYEYIIWGNNENISRMRQSRHFFIDGTFHHPPEFTQLLLIMYKDIITSLKIPGLYILLNSKKEALYNYAFRGLLDLLTDNNKINLHVETIVTDQEKALINIVKLYFPNTQRISCLFHYKQDILKNLKSYGLFHKTQKKDSNIILYELGKFPFKYKGNINYIIENCEMLTKNYPLYGNFINNYFLKYHLVYFQDNSLNYNNIPKDCRSNSFLENYNGYIKQRLGKNRLINWVNFIDFIKSESSRSIQKLLTAANSNITKTLEKKLKNTLKVSIKKEYQKDDINIEKKYFEFSNTNNLNEHDTVNITENKDFVNIITNSTLGFKNIGDTCYMNSAIQVLIHLKKLIENLIVLNNDNRNNLTKALIELIKDFYELIKLSENNPFVKNSILFYTPVNFYHQFINKYTLFSNGQHDSMEFIRLLLNELIEDNFDKESKSTYHDIDNNNKSKFELCKEYDKFFKSREHSYIHDIFYFQTITTYSCICGYNSYVCENLLEIPILLSEEKVNLKLEELLNCYFKEEKIPWDDKCWNCKKKKTYKTNSFI